MRVCNWSKTFSCCPEQIFVPESEEDIKKICQKSVDENKPLKVMGLCQSPSDIAFTDGYLINMCKMNKLIEVNVDTMKVTVQAGMSLKDLNEIHLPQYEMALSIQGAISEVTLGGVISTATHGSGIQRGTFCSSVMSLSIITLDGQIIHCSREENHEVFLSVCCGLGSVGIILEVTLQCEKAFNLHQLQYGCPLTQVLESLDNHLSASDYFKFFWFPHTPDTVVFHAKKTNMPATRKQSWFWSYLIGYYLLEFLYWISTFIPSMVPFINRIYYNILYKIPQETIDRSDKVLNFECLFSQYVNEWCIPMTHTAAVLLELKSWLEKQSVIKVHFPVEVRFTKSEEFYLSPTHGRNSTYINIIMYKPYKKPVEYKEYWAAYQSIMKKYEGRPHWAKAHDATKNDFLVMYPEFEKWCEIRNRLDPKKLLFNDYMERIFKD